MRRWVAGFGTGLCLLASASCGRPAPVSAGTQTITGRVVCLVCYARNSANTGHDHDSGFACDRACVRWEGNPAGLVSDDGKLYQLAGGLVANNNEKISEYLAETVRITGEVSEKDAMPIIAADDVTRVDGASD